jgi:hypothetical protein
VLRAVVNTLAIPPHLLKKGKTAAIKIKEKTKITPKGP